MYDIYVIFVIRHSNIKTFHFQPSYTKKNHWNDRSLWSRLW